MLGDHARTLDLALERADAQLLPGSALLRELAGASGSRHAVTDAITASSPVSWQHINLHGEFDISDFLMRP